jgi:hypothetical protein
MSGLSEARSAERAAFLKEAGWDRAAATPLAGDASTRSYERLSRGGMTALLMNAPVAAESAACPPDAAPEQRRALGYNAMARLAGPNLNAFLCVAKTLREAGLSAPEIYADDASRGFALIEDFGDALYARAIPQGAPEETLYAASVDSLLQLRAAAPSPPASRRYTMLSYDRTALEAEIALLPDWYWAFRTGAGPQQDVREEYFAAWASALDRISPPATLVMRDYHAENLLWLPERTGHRRAGVIDFQDALVGHAAYDLVSLLEDARRDVDPALAEAMIARYAKGASAIGRFDEAEFLSDYAILAAQRNAKILGIFARLVVRDGKRRYADFLPRVESLFRRDLSREPLAEVRAFFARRMPELAP